ncbi:MAG: hypothetical protein HFJ50_03440 [Clostridia bacterium]|jgi:hypothetical protein|nr:hypothetical protein [Clostridia bacterium]
MLKPERMTHAMIRSTAMSKMFPNQSLFMMNLLISKNGFWVSTFALDISTYIITQNKLKVNINKER